MADYVKADDLGFVSQIKTFSEKLPTYQPLFGLSPAQLAAAEADAEFMAFAVLGNNSTNAYRQGWTALKKNARKGDGGTPISTFPAPVDVSSPPAPVLPGVETRFRALVGQIKAHPEYTSAIGEDLGIVADEDTSTLNAPVLTLTMKGGYPVISFKKGKSDGIKLYSRRGSEADFSFLAVDTQSPYVDNRPNLVPGTTEKRQYYAYFILKDEEVGDVSATVNVNVG